MVLWSLAPYGASVGIIHCGHNSAKFSQVILEAESAALRILLKIFL